MNDKNGAKHVVSLKSARELKKAGYPLDTEFVWNEKVTYIRRGKKDGTCPYEEHSRIAVIFHKDSDEIEPAGNDDYRGEYRTERFVYPAPLATELLEKLPYHRHDSRETYYLRIAVDKKDYIIFYKSGSYTLEEYVKDKYLPDALARMWVLLKTGKIYV